MTVPSAGSLLVVGVAGLELTTEESDLLHQLQPGGVILFGRNVKSAEQLRDLTARLRATLPEALLCVDAEGGRVDRLRAVVGPAPAAARLADLPPRRSEQAGRWIGHSLRAFDCDVDFAPVLDLDHGAERNALDGRYLGSHPTRIVSRGRAFLRGLHGSGVLGCVKHFPGLGAARHDTHHEPAVVDLDADGLAADLTPFRQLADDAGAVMVAHAAYPRMTGDDTPATLSSTLMDQLLRRDLRFEGLVVSDDLEMKALDRWGDLPHRTLRALEAGCDALPICSQLSEALQVALHLERHAEPGRIREAQGRWRAYRQRRGTLRASRRRYQLATVRSHLERLTGL